MQTGLGRLPGPRSVKAIQALVLVVAVIAFCFLWLAKIGAGPGTDPVEAIIGRVLTFLYFAFFITMPVWTKLDKTKPVIFACNGAECWKSYKAAKVAAAKGFKSVYWLRGGLPEWDAGGLPTEGG